jgi:hypothetical protein
MTCSKIFSGDIPELTNEIIQHFKYDFSTLYSCILVNRLWCRLAIPLLWEDPFSIPTQNYRCIKIYLYYLNESRKAKFNGYGIGSNLLPSNTLFNYPGFIKYLNIHNICCSIEKWVETLMDSNHNNYKELKKLVYRSLFKVFVENEGNLHSFEVMLSTNSDYRYFNDNMELTLQNPNFIYNIKNLVFNIHYSFLDITNIIPFLKFLPSNCNSISSLIFKFSTFTNNNNNPSIIDKYLSEIIISQHNLEIISFESITPLHDPFLSLKNSNCTNTLNTIIFYLIDFKNIIPIIQEVFDQLNVLKSIHIIYCYSLNSDFVQQIIKVIKPFKLKSLFMDQILHVGSLQLLLQKFGDYLENFGFGFMDDEYIEPKCQLFKIIAKYCTKINYFDPGVPEDIYIYSLIKKHENHINYLTIEVDVYDDYTINNEISSTVLQSLGQVLPSKLEYLCLKLLFSANDLEIFLKNSQNIFIKKLLIGNIIQNEFKNFDNILFYIKEYIMKKERVKYLAILETFPGSDEDDKELFSLKDEVNEFKLYNIIVQKYCNQYINARDFVNNYIQF